MPNIWMLDVLADLRRFAENEGLSEIATTFDVAGMAVARQLASHEERSGTRSRPMVSDIIERLLAARTLAEVEAEVFRLRNDLDVEHVTYHAVNASGGAIVAVTFPDHWVDRYLSQNYARIDPVVQAAFSSYAPVDWRRLGQTGRAVRQFWNEAEDAGIRRHGLSVPIRGPGGQFALFSSDKASIDRRWEMLLRERSNDLLLLSHYFNEATLRITQGRFPEETTERLSPREVDALTLLAIGLSRSKAAETLEISEHTLRVYIESARAKLKALNTVHAVSKAVVSGQIVV